MCAGISLTFEKHRLISKPNQSSELLLWIVSRCKLTVKGYKHASTYHFTVNQSCFLCRICVGNSAPVVSNSTQMGMLVTTSATQSKFNLLIQTAAQTAALYRKLVGISGARLATCITSMHIACTLHCHGKWLQICVTSTPMLGIRTCALVLPMLPWQHGTHPAPLAAASVDSWLSGCVCSNGNCLMC